MRVKELKIENLGPIKEGYSENNVFYCFPR